MFDLWCLDSGNRVIETSDVVLVWQIAKDMLETDWTPNELSLGLPDGRVLEGEALATWVGNQ